MTNIVWKKFTLDSLFEFDSSNQLPFTKKQLDVSETKDDTYNIAIVAQSERNNGITGYIDGSKIDPSKIMKNVMIYSLNFGTCFYQQNDFVLLDTHGSIFRLIAREYELRKILESDKIVGNFFSKLIMKICKNGVYNYNWKPNSSRAGLELIMLPCVETNDAFIWQEDGKKYTLAIDYITKLMVDAKALLEKRTIKRYQTEKEELENKRKSFEQKYLCERKQVVWKKFVLGNIFEFDSGNQLPFTKKQLDVSDDQDGTYDIAIVTQSERNNGISGYIDKTTIDSSKIMKNVMIYSLNFGTCFYQENDFVLLDTHGSIFRLLAKDYNLRNFLEANNLVGNFISKLIMKICKNGVYNYNWKPNSQRASLETIMLPCIEVAQSEVFFFEDRGHYYKLADSFISYLYLTGKINNKQRMIEGHVHQY